MLEFLIQLALGCGLTLFGFAWYPCGCGTNCVLYSDSFDRADSTSLGADWTEEAGDPEIDTNRLVFTGPDEFASYDNTAGITAAVAVRAIVQASDSGNKARLCLHVTDEDNYTCAELEFGTDLVSIIERIAGVETILKQCTATLDTATDYDAVFVIDRIANPVACTAGTPSEDNVTDYTAGLYLDDVLVLASMARNATGKAALGTGDTVAGEVQFDDFEIRKAQQEEAECENGLTCCWPFFGQLRTDMPAQMRFVLTGFDYGGNTMDGTYDCDLLPYAAGNPNTSPSVCFEYCAIYRVDFPSTGLGCDDGASGCLPTFVEIRIGRFGVPRVCYISVLYGACLSGTKDVSLDCTDGPVTIVNGTTACFSVHPFGTMTVEAL
jgi:hypothetical protein